MLKKTEESVNFFRTRLGGGGDGGGSGGGIDNASISVLKPAVLQLVPQ